MGLRIKTHNKQRFTVVDLLSMLSTTDDYVSKSIEFIAICLIKQQWHFYSSTYFHGSHNTFWLQHALFKQFLLSRLFCVFLCFVFLREFAYTHAEYKSSNSEILVFRQNKFVFAFFVFTLNLAQLLPHIIGLIPLCKPTGINSNSSIQAPKCRDSLTLQS